MERGFRRWQRFAVLAVVSLAFILRIDGIDFGLDRHDVSRAVLYNQVDEYGMVQSVLRGFLRGHMNPGDFLNRGPAGFYVFGLVDAAVLAPSAAADPDGWRGVRRRLERNPSPVHLLHRSVSALAGVLTVLALMRLCRREIGPLAALVAGLLLATAYLHVRESHFGTVDALWGLLTVLTVDQTLLLARGPTARRYAAAGLLVGLTTATKYFSVSLVLQLIAAHLVARSIAGRDSRPRPSARLLLFGLALVPVGFVVGAPNALFATQSLVGRVASLMGTAVVGPSPLRPWLNLVHHFRYTLWVGLGETVFPLALIGLVILWRRGGTQRLLAVSPLLSSLSIFFVIAAPVRYGIALMILFVPPAAAAAAALLARLPRLLAGAVLLVLLLPPVARSIAFNRLIARPDTRVEMMQAIRARGADPTEVLAVGLHGLPLEPPGRKIMYNPLYDYPSLLQGQPPDVSHVLSSPPAYILRDLASLVPPSVGWNRLQALVDEEYREVVRLDGRKDPSRTVLPDPAAGTPTHMIPFAEPWAMTRPGPPLVLYERIRKRTR